jgi:hypothetical protein
MPVARKTWQPEPVLEPGFGGAPADHAVGIHPVHRCRRERAGLARSGAEEGALTVAAEPGRFEILVEVHLDLWCTGISWRLPPRALAYRLASRRRCFCSGCDRARDWRGHGSMVRRRAAVARHRSPARTRDCRPARGHWSAADRRAVSSCGVAGAGACRIRRADRCRYCPWPVHRHGEHLPRRRRRRSCRSDMYNNQISDKERA